MRKSGPTYIHVDRFGNARLGEATDGLGKGIRSVVDHDVDGTEAFHGGGNESTHVAQRAHMAGDAGGVDAHGSQCLLRFGTRVGLSTRDNHASPGMPEPFGNRAADPASTPGDQRHPPIKAEEPTGVEDLGIILYIASIGTSC